MKRARYVLWVLIALLLPLRGALAVAMPCAWGDAFAGQGQLMAQAQAVDEAPCPMHAAPPQGPSPSPDEPSQVATCGLCAAACGAVLPSLPAAFLLGEAPAASAGFPALTLPPYAFQRDGPDRPPRLGRVHAPS